MTTSTNKSGLHPNASLYVGDLLPEVTEGMLFEVFNQVGPVSSIRVCRDALTKRSLGYAYVNFHALVDAERALDTLNNAVIHGKACRIMWSQRDPTIRKTGVGNIFIKNLDPSISHKELFDTFSQFGNILSCKVAQDENGNSKGFGFVHFESNENAENAITRVNGMMLATKQVYVAKFVSKKERLRQRDGSWTNVFVKDLDPEVTTEQLERIFSEFGKVQNCKIMDDEEGKSKGFGFVNFENHEDAVKAVEKMHASTIAPHEKKIWCGRAQKKTDREHELRKKFEQLKLERINKYQGINLYIKNLEDDVDEERLQKEFASFGNIRSVKIMSDEKGNSRGFGFICFSSAEEAQRAINEMNTRILQGCSKPLYVAYHEPKEIRRNKLSQRSANRAKGVAPGVAPGGPAIYGAQPTVYYTAGAPVHTPMMYPQPPLMPRAQRGGWPQAAPYMQPYSQVIPGMHGQGRGGPHGRGMVGGRGRGMRRQVQQAPGIPEQQVPQDGPLTLAMLNSLPIDQQKIQIGERLYPRIVKIEPDLAGKITGMFLDSGWEMSELLSLLTDNDKLRNKIHEAVIVLQRAKDEDQ